MADKKNKIEPKRLRNILALFLCLAGYYGIVRLTKKGIPCPFHSIFHLKCPGCGITHMLLALSQGRFFMAFQSNPVIFCFLPFLAWIILKAVWSYLTCVNASWQTWENYGMRALVVILAAFGVVRNLI